MRRPKAIICVQMWTFPCKKMRLVALNVKNVARSLIDEKGTFTMLSIHTKLIETFLVKNAIIRYVDNVIVTLGVTVRY